MPFTIVRQDITKMDVDAIVNAANTNLCMGGGVCGAIFKAAGANKLQAACDKLSPIQTGHAAITPGFGLPAKHIIHAAGPRYGLQTPAQSEQLLADTYRNSLVLATKNGLKSIAFPLISSGIYGYPKAEALLVARETITNYLDQLAQSDQDDLTVYLTVFDTAAFALSEKLAGEIESYIDEHYVAAHSTNRRSLLACEDGNMIPISCAPMPPMNCGLMPPMSCAPTPSMDVNASGLAHCLETLDDSFCSALLKLIDTKGKTDVEVYKRANIDRKLFSKIRTGKGYTPSKKTILALAISLELSLEETADLLQKQVMRYLAAKNLT